jgi:uncharacterized protein
MFAVERICCTAVPAILLEAGADPCACVTGSVTALHRAARAGVAESCKLLLEQIDALIEAKDLYGRTPLRYAASKGELNCAKVLLQHGAAVNAVDNRHRTPLFAASMHQQAKMAAHLLAAGADVNAVDYEGDSALLAALQSDSTALVRLLLNNGADITITNNKGQDVLYKAACFGHVSLMETLVKRGLSVHSATDSSRRTLLMMVVMIQQQAAAEWLIQHDVAVNAVRRDGCTALHCACLEGSGDSAAMIELLLANGADVHKCDSSGRTALDTAANYGSVQCMSALVAAGADVNHTDSTGKYSLHIAADMQHAAAVQLLLQHGAAAVMNTVQRLDPNYEVISNGMTALMMCTTTDTLKVLLAAGADVHVSNELGDTCLHAAARCMPALTAPVVCVLIKAGADLHAVNTEGLTAAQLAHDAGNTLIEQLLNRAAEQQQQ